MNGHQIKKLGFPQHIMTCLQHIMNIAYNIMLLSHLCEYACEWAYACGSAPICNDRKKFVGVRKYSSDVHKHSRGFVILLLSHLCKYDCEWAYECIFITDLQ